MTDRYFDWYNGSDGNDGLSINTPKKSYDVYRAGGGTTAGDRVFFKRGTPQYFSTANIDVKAGSSDSVRTLYGAYGSASVPYAFWYPGGAGDFIINGSARSYVDYQDIYFDMLGQVSYPVYSFASGASPNVGHRFTRCMFTGAKSGQAGILFGATATSTGDAGDYLFEYCRFFNNPGHGTIPNGAHSVRYRYCIANGNGYDAIFGGHGFSNKYRTTDPVSGFVKVGATNVWQRTLAAYELQVYYCRAPVNGYYKLTENTTTPTTPNAGEFGQSAGILYINVGVVADMNAVGVNYAWGRCFNLVYEYCEAYGNIADPRAAFLEGHGFAFDGYTDDSKILSCNSHDNQGAGYSVNQGDRNLVHGSVGKRNNAAGIVAAATLNTDIQHNTLIENNNGPAPYDGEIYIFTKSTIRLNNNDMQRGLAGTYGINRDGTCTISGTRNNAYGYTAVENGATLTNSSVANSQRDMYLRPQNAALRGVGTPLGRKDFYGKPFLAAPSIGAIEAINSTRRLAFSKR